ncbi:hypothetical protein K438DRAFT_1967266 [Mycena galopus ATCC 62051]|nr:hypothetical protein K438DRAFT_1967266 [Mycena galopus ATCC 62051]
MAVRPASLSLKSRQSSNFLAGFGLLMKQADGSFVLAWPVGPTTVVPLIDADRDYGIFVRHALELPAFPDGGQFMAYGENIVLQDLGFYPDEEHIFVYDNAT